MMPNPPSSSGCMTSSTPPEPAAGSTTTAAAPSAEAAADGWERRGPYRISKSFVARRHIGTSPVYHCFHLHAFLGACPSPDDAKALCDQHQGGPTTHTPP